MRYRKLGRTGLTVSEICLGTMTFGGDGFWKVIGALPQAEVTALVKSAFDKGVTFIDTANVYSNGLSEQVTGQAIKSLPRDELVIATKVFGRMGAYGGEQTPEAQRRYNNTNLWGLSRKHIFDSIDASLKRLDVDYIDLYQVHSFDPLTPLEETMEALDEVVKSGKARYIGLCNYAAWQSPRRSVFRRANNWRVMNRCRCTIPSPVATSNAKSCRWRRTSSWPFCRGVRWLAVSYPANTHATARPPKALAASRSTSRPSTKRKPTTSSI
jgi:aryl-alcohol dehydrogenase-like predicted oxidoreductase